MSITTEQLAEWRVLSEKARPDVPFACSDCCDYARAQRACAAAVPALIAEVERLNNEVVRLRTNNEHHCACAVADGAARPSQHAKDCPIRVFAHKRVAPEVALDRLAAALDSGDKIDELRAQLETMTAARDELADIAATMLNNLDRNAEAKAGRIAAPRAVDKKKKKKKKEGAP